MRVAYINPFFNQLRGRLANAEAATQAWRAMDQTVMAMTAQPKNGVPVHMIQAALDRMRGYHRKRVIQSFRAALGLDITRVLSEPEISVFMAHKLSENVDLIKTIPIRVHAGLKARLALELQRAPFDQQVLTQMVRKEYGSTGYNLRRIVRDQTSKTVAGLTEIRQRQLGIDGYEWLTSQDERVRPSHLANSGQFFLWSKPPSTTGPPGEDIQCRCVAIPVVLNADRDRLKERSGPTSTTELDLHPPPTGARARVRPSPPPSPPPPFRSASVSVPGARQYTIEAFNETFESANQKAGAHAARQDFRGPYKIAEILDDIDNDVMEYQTRGISINAKMRNGDALLPDEKEMIDDITRVSSEATEESVYWRGFNGVPDVKQGDVQGIMAPMSTTADPRHARSFSGAMGGEAPFQGTVMEIHVRKGTRGLAFNKNEAEYLISPGQKMRIIDVREDVKMGEHGNVKRYIVAEVTP